MNKNTLYLFFILVFSECKPFGKLSTIDEKNTLEKVIDKRTSNNESEYFFCERVNVKLNEDETQNFSAKIFIHRGESIFINLSYFLGLEMARVQITNDSIKYINRVKREYYFGKIENLKKLAGINLTFEEIQNIILKGIPLTYKDNKRKILLKFIETDNDFIYNYELDSKKLIRVYFDKKTIKEYKVEFADHNNKLYIVGYLNNYLNEPEYPGIINLSLLRSDKKTDISISIDKIENRYFTNTLFKVNNNYNELVF